MFRVMLYSQWKWCRLIVVLGSVAGFALPLVSVQGAARADSSPLQAGELLQAVQSWGTLYPVLAAALGLLVASVANVDFDLLGKLQVAVLNWPGPLAIFTGRWMLIDV